jgi:hypothetical protein
VVDAVNHAHFFGVVEDTASHERSVIEVHETSTGWQSRVITSDLKESTNLKYGNIDPMGNALSASISPDGTFFSLVWLDAAVQGDTLPDIWLAYRHISGGWSVPVNLTETPTMAELLLHAAPTLKVNGNGSHTMFLGRTYQAGTTAYPPDESMRSIFFAGSYVITPAWIGHGQAEPGAFRLDQNYPNPFNSATVMSYELRVKSRVRLVVYDLLGREVATLVNEVKAPGTYTATWDGGRFASGMYFCRLAAGGYVQTRKMVLQR